jgi:hypothetical protein
MGTTNGGFTLTVLLAVADSAGYCAAALGGAEIIPSLADNYRHISSAELLFWRIFPKNAKKT